MEGIKGILALFVACILLCALVNFFFFFRHRKNIKDILITVSVIFLNQIIEFISSFWGINEKIVVFLYIMTFNFSLSFLVYYLLKSIQPGSVHNWKSFLLPVLLLPASFVYFSTFSLIEPGFFFTEFRYFASPLASTGIGIILISFGLYFLLKLLMENRDLRKVKKYRWLLYSYILPLIIMIVLPFLVPSAFILFESIFSKLIVISFAGLFYFHVLKAEN